MKVNTGCSDANCVEVGWTSGYWRCVNKQIIVHLQFAESNQSVIRIASSKANNSSMKFDASGWSTYGDDPRITVMECDVGGRPAAGFNASCYEKCRIEPSRVGSASLVAALRESTSRSIIAARQRADSSFIIWLMRTMYQALCFVLRRLRRGTEEPQPIRLIQNERSLESLCLTVNVDESTARLTATLSWQYDGPSVDMWQVTLVNLTWSQGDYCTYHQWVFFVPNGFSVWRDRSFKLPLWFKAGNRYRVTVTGLKQQNSQRSDGVVVYSVQSSGSTEFRTGPVMSIRELQRLYNYALKFVEEKGSRRAECKWIYRNKPRDYFDRILRKRNGIMHGHLKDASGDLRCPINGELSGLFFLANAQSNGQPLSQSPFGSSRVLVDAMDMLTYTRNIYFADFYCMKRDGPHYVVLVLTNSGSVEDEFCDRHLVRLSLDDPARNPFLFRRNGRVFVANHSCFVEVFFTADLPIRNRPIIDGVQVICKGSSTQGGVAKSSNCSTCDVSGYRTPTAPFGVDVF